MDRRFCVAPMMRRTDRHFRFLLRMLSHHAVLYSEMIGCDALLHGSRRRLLAFHQQEHPVGLQVAGRDARRLARCAVYAEQAGYDEVNINVGCPSASAQAGGFGACLMAEPQRVADCVAAMVAQVKIPVTIKCRLGIDQQDDGAMLQRLMELSYQAGCRVFIIHARRAMLARHVSAKDNRTVPPLDYQAVYRIKRRWPTAEIILNGGLNDLQTAQQVSEHVDGVMMGRAVYSNPMLLAQVDHLFYGLPLGKPITRQQLLMRYWRYAVNEVEQGAHKSLRAITCHAAGLWRGQPAASFYRRHLCTPQPCSWEKLSARWQKTA